MFVVQNNSNLAQWSHLPVYGSNVVDFISSNPEKYFVLNPVAHIVACTFSPIIFNGQMIIIRRLGLNSLQQPRHIIK